MKNILFLYSNRLLQLNSSASLSARNFEMSAFNASRRYIESSIAGIRIEILFPKRSVFNLSSISTTAFYLNEIAPLDTNI